MRIERTEATRGGYSGDRRLRRLGVLLAAGGRPRGQGRHAVWRAVRFHLPRRRGRPPGRVPAPPRSPAHDPAAPDQLPGQRLGDEVARRQGGDLAVRRWVAGAPRQARRLRRVRPVRRPDERPGGHVLRRPHRDPPLVGRDRTTRSCASWPSRPSATTASRSTSAARSSSSRDRASRPSPSRSGSAMPAGKSST